MAAQRLEADGSGRAILRKSAPPGPDAERLRREAALLRAAAHPGVVALREEHAGDDGGVELVLAVAGSRTLADLHVDLRGVADVVAALATTVADLHDLGVVHGRLTADHVVIDASGRPVVCGFADAGPPTAARTAAADVAALGELLRLLVGPTATTGDSQWEPIPERRFARGERWQGYARRALLNVADQATTDDLDRRLSARRLAAAVLAARPEVRRGVDVGDLGAVARRAATPLAATVGLGLLVFGAGSLLRPAAPPDAEAVVAPAPPAVTTPAPPSAPTATARPVGSPPGGFRALECAVVAGPAADPDGDGCASPVHLADGVVEVDGVRYGVGRPGDLLAVGDWDCDGAATVALVHAGSGEVFVFDGWATGAAAAEATSRASVPDAAGVEVLDDDGDGCPVLVVVDTAGDRTEVTA